MNKKIRIAVLVSGNGTNLQALINAQKNKIIKRVFAESIYKYALYLMCYFCFKTASIF